MRLDCRHRWKIVKQIVDMVTRYEISKEDDQVNVMFIQ